MCFDVCETWDGACARARRFILFFHFSSLFILFFHLGVVINYRIPSAIDHLFSAHREVIENYLNGDFRKFILVDDEALDIMGKGDI